MTTGCARFLELDEISFIKFELEEEGVDWGMLSSLAVNVATLEGYIPVMYTSSR